MSSTNLILAFSNLLGLPALVKSQGYDKLVVGAVMIASFLMHISETKHRLDPPYLRRYSNLLLTIDRIISYIVGPYIFYRFYYNYDINLLPIAVIGIISLRLGEVKSFETVPYFNSYYYPLLHLVWHASVYYILYRTL